MRLVQSIFLVSGILSGINAQLRGGDGGQPFTFTCAENTFVTELKGRAARLVDQLIVKCSDGKESPPAGGGGGDPFNLPADPTGIKIVNVKTGSRVDSIEVAGQKAGGDGGDAFPFADPNGCPIVGFNARSGDTLDAIEFLFKCPPTVQAQSKSFTCPPDKFITTISGRSGSSIDAIKVGCSDGSGSEYFGASTGTEFNLNEVKDGVKQIVTTSTTNVNSIKIGDQKAGSETGNAFTSSDPNNCPANGITVDWSTFVTAVRFTFACPKPAQPDQKTDTFACPKGSFITQLTGHSGDFVDNVKFKCSDGSMSNQFGQGNGNPFTLAELPGGLKNIKMIANDQWLISIEYDGTKTGGSSAGTPTIASHPNGCPAASVSVTHAQFVKGISFNFDCRINGGNNNNGTANSTVIIVPTLIVPKTVVVKLDVNFKLASSVIPADQCDVCANGGGTFQVSSSVAVSAVAQALKTCNKKFEKPANAYAMAQALASAQASGDPNAAGMMNELINGGLDGSASAKAIAAQLSNAEISKSASANAKAFASASASAHVAPMSIDQQQSQGASARASASASASTSTKSAKKCKCKKKNQNQSNSMTM